MRGWLGRTATVTALVALASTRTASAQPVRPLVPGVSSDTLTLPDARDASASWPLTLGLLSGAVPHAFGTPGCEPAGHATGLLALPTTNLAANGVRLLKSARLTLFGFSRDGCAFDRAVGGGIALTIPVTKNVAFLWGGGAIYLPHRHADAPKYETEVRAGIVWTTSSGRSYNLGVSVKSDVPRVTFGGNF